MADYYGDKLSFKKIDNTLCFFSLITVYLYNNGNSRTSKYWSLEVFGDRGRIYYKND